MEAPTTPLATGGRSTRGWIAITIAAAAAAGVLAGVIAHLSLPSPARSASPELPELHGQSTWPAATRRAPQFTLNDVLGGSPLLPSAERRVTLIAFLDSQCRSLCPVIGRQLGYLQRAFPARTRPEVVVVSVNPAGDTAASVHAAMRRWNAGPGWRWLSGTPTQLARVWRAYGIEVRPTTRDIVHGAAVYLVDSRGFERAGYLAPLLPNFVALDIRRVEARAPA